MTEKCLECNEPATWTRSTQFAGDHPYCEKHAHQQKDFHDEPDSYSYWYENIMAGVQSTCDDSTGYEESTLEKQQEFARKRNYPL
jgi:hypothetical protein